MAIEAEHRGALRNETIVSVGINAVLPSAVIWLLDVAPPRTLTGPEGILGAMLPAAGLATLMMTLTLTAIIRARVRKGQLPALDWPRRDRGAMRYVPQPLLLRAPALALLAVALLVPPGLGAVALLDILPLTKLGFLVFNLVYGSVVGLVMARFVVLPALADPVAASAIPAAG